MIDSRGVKMTLVNINFTDRKSTLVKFIKLLTRKVKVKDLLHFCNEFLSYLNF